MAKEPAEMDPDEPKAATSFDHLISAALVAAAAAILAIVAVVVIMHH